MCTSPLSLGAAHLLPAERGAAGVGAPGGQELKVSEDRGGMRLAQGQQRRQGVGWAAGRGLTSRRLPRAECLGFCKQQRGVSAGY